MSTAPEESWGPSASDLRLAVNRLAEPRRFYPWMGDELQRAPGVEAQRHGAAPTFRTLESGRLQWVPERSAWLFVPPWWQS